jgi:hypothetical protein
MPRLLIVALLPAKSGCYPIRLSVLMGDHSIN